MTGVGRKTFQKIDFSRRKLGESWSDFWVGRRSIWQKIGIQDKIVESIKKFKKEYTINSYWESLCKSDISVFDEYDSLYPQWLFHEDDRPLILFVKGSVVSGGSERDPIWDKNPIAIVGTRKMTPYGRLVTRKIARELTLEGATIISGFMYGVDVCAQKEALDSGGKTVGVLGYGFDHLTPRNQSQLFAEMLGRGAVFVTEYPPWMPGSPGTFPARNRIVAGMSRGVVVTEAAQKSGSHITASLALEYGREVFAVPGSITSPYSVGTKELIKQGAILVGSGREVLEELNGAEGWSSGEKKAKKGEVSIDLSEEPEKVIQNCLTTGMMDTDEIDEVLKLSTSQTLRILSLMEVKGVVSRFGEKWCLVGRVQ